MTEEKSCRNCKHYPTVVGIPTVNDWSKRCWDCVGVSTFSGNKLALFEHKDYDMRKDLLEKLKK